MLGREGGWRLQYFLTMGLLIKTGNRLQLKLPLRSNRAVLIFLQEHLLRLCLESWGLWRTQQSLSDGPPALCEFTYEHTLSLTFSPAQVKRSPVNHHQHFLVGLSRAAVNQRSSQNNSCRWRGHPRDVIRAPDLTADGEQKTGCRCELVNVHKEQRQPQFKKKKKVQENCPNLSVYFEKHISDRWATWIDF